MLVFCKLPGVRIDIPVIGGEDKRIKVKSISFESPVKGVEVPDEFGNSLIKTLPNVYSAEPFGVPEKKISEPVEETKTEPIKEESTEEVTEKPAVSKKKKK